MAGTQGRHRVKRQEELLTGGAREGGRWESGRIVSDRRRRAGCSVTHTWHWWHSFWFLVDSTRSTLLKKTIQRCLGSSPFFFFLHHRWHGSCWIATWMVVAASVYCSAFGPVLPKTNRVSWSKENPLPSPAPRIPLVLQLLLPLVAPLPQLFSLLFPLLSLGTS